MLQAGRQSLETLMQPPTDRQIAVFMARLFRFAKAFSIPATSVQDATEFYRAVFSKIPADLVEAALTRTIDNWRYGSRLPLPGEIREHIDAEHGRRIALFYKVDTALKLRSMAEQRGAR